MNCQSDVFEELMELYPDTADNIKIRSLEKREVFTYYLQKARYRQLTRLNTSFGKKENTKFNKWLHLTTFEDSENDSDDYEFHISKPFTLDKTKYKDSEKLLEDADFFSSEREADSNEEDEFTKSTVASIKSSVNAMDHVIKQFLEEKPAGSLGENFKE